jgi:RNA polymerase sigma-70 factor (ECF subfamily)
VTHESDYKAAFADLMEAYAGPIRRLCSVYAVSTCDREDLFQDIFLAVWRALPAFRGDSSARTWLYRIAHNVALTWQARDRRRHSCETALDEEEDVASSDHLDLRSLALNQAVAAMRPGDRALTLLWLEGLSAAEIEDVTGVKAATVAVRLSRIRKQLTPTEVTV